MALRYHRFPRPGKIEVLPTKPYSSQLDLSLAYSPGVAYPCLEIKDNKEDVYEYTDKGNLVGVVSNCTAVLGLGDIGAEAGKPVMEGKALLFKIFAGIDAFDIEINEKDPDKVVEAVKAISPTFGGINLEDIKSPQCFTIEQRLREECDIPVMHDDQHGTAIISAAALLNALIIQDKKIEDIRLVVNGAGAAAVSCTRLYLALGVKKENVVMCDSKGPITTLRENLPPQKQEFATDRDLNTLAEAVKDADVFLGLSVADVLTPDMVLSMAQRPIVFALANPDPEIDYNLAMSTRPDLIMATGRSDYPNQVNNVLGFPYIFRGALDSRASTINEAMKLGAVHAIAELARKPVPRVVDIAYGDHHLTFGRDYILPKPMDPRLLSTVAVAVAKSAADSGVARKPINDYDAYSLHLQRLIGKDTRLMRRVIELAKREPRHVVLAEGKAENVLRAASMLAISKICLPTLLGDEQEITSKANELGIDISGVTIVSPHSQQSSQLREKYAETLFHKLEREGMTLSTARRRMLDEDYFGLMMVETGDADAFLGSTYSSAGDISATARRIIGLRSDVDHFATMHIISTRKGTFFLADTAVNLHGDVQTLTDTALLAADAVKFFGHEPVMAMLSYSTFGSGIDTDRQQESLPGSPQCVAKAVECLHKDCPSLCVDGEMQANYALDTNLRDEMFPFSTLYGKDVNTLIFPDLNSANICFRMMLEMGIGDVIGPIQLGLNKPVHFINSRSDVQDIVNLAAIAALDSTAMRRSESSCRMTPHSK